MPRSELLTPTRSIPDPAGRLCWACFRFLRSFCSDGSVDVRAVVIFFSVFPGMPKSVYLPVCLPRHRATAFARKRVSVSSEVRWGLAWYSCACRSGKKDSERLVASAEITNCNQLYVYMAQMTRDFAADYLSDVCWHMTWDLSFNFAIVLSRTHDMGVMRRHNGQVFSIF